MQEPSPNERVQRIRIGLTGLAFVFLLVLLGTAIGRSGSNGAPAVQGNGLANDVEPDEPLAQLGVAPGQSTTENQSSGEARTP